MKVFYTSFALWSIFATLPRVPQLDPTIWRSLKNAGIAKLSSQRGCRAGRNKQRSITPVLGYGRYQAFNSGFCTKSTNGFLLPRMQISPEIVEPQP